MKYDDEFYNDLDLIGDKTTDPVTAINMVKKLGGDRYSLNSIIYGNHKYQGRVLDSIERLSRVYCRKCVENYYLGKVSKAATKAKDVKRPAKPKVANYNQASNNSNFNPFESHKPTKANNNNASAKQIKYVKYLIYRLSNQYNNSYGEIAKEICHNYKINSISTKMPKNKASQIIEWAKNILPSQDQSLRRII